MLVKSLLAIGAVLVIAFSLYLFYLGKVSRTGAAPGLVDGKLAPCPDTPNCVCSEFPDHRTHYVDAIRFNGDPEQALQTLASLVIERQGVVISQTDQYLATTFTSSLFGFVDDVEFRVDPDHQRIHVRSASRVGRGDLDANRKRVDAIQAEFTQN